MKSCGMEFTHLIGCSGFEERMGRQIQTGLAANYFISPLHKIFAENDISQTVDRYTLILAQRKRDTTDYKREPGIRII